MSTLTYTRSGIDSVAHTDAPARKPFWRRLLDAIVAAQQRRAEREIASYLARRGGLLNDEAEREIMLRLSGGRRTSVWTHR